MHFQKIAFLVGASFIATAFAATKGKIYCEAVCKGNNVVGTFQGLDIKPNGECPKRCLYRLALPNDVFTCTVKEYESMCAPACKVNYANWVSDKAGTTTIQTLKDYMAGSGVHTVD